MEKEKNSKSHMLITGVVLLFLFVGCLFILNKLGYLSFNKISCTNNDNNSENIKESNQLTSDSNISYRDISDKVYISYEDGGYNLTLWSNGTYIFTNGNNDVESLGNYVIEDNLLKLNYLFIINRNSTDGDKAVLNEGSRTFRIVDYGFEDDNIRLTSANQSPSPGGQNFYTILNDLLK